MANIYDSEDDDWDIVELSVLALTTVEPNIRKKRSCWVRPWISRREEFGAYHSLLAELESEDCRAYCNFLRMKKSNFSNLLELVTPKITKQDTQMRSAISPGEKLAITLRFLATGDSYQSMEYLYRIPKNTISGFVPDVCQAIYDALRQDYLQVPSTEGEWLEVSNNFEERWQFPHCIGALDGKHLAIRCPSGSGSAFYNYKNFYSIVLLALVDANCKFIYIDVGANGRASDAGIFANSSLFKALEENRLNLPIPKPLIGREEPLPYFIVGDDAFPLKPYLMKPYPFKNHSKINQVFNYRLSRARRISENAFGILVHRFGIFQRPINLDHEKAIKVTLAAVVLHIFLRSSNDTTYSDGLNLESRLETNSVVPFVQQGGNRNSNSARLVREELTDYFQTCGQVEWQWARVL